MAHKVCLITPPSPFLLDERVFMTLGILKITAVLEQATMYVEVLDLSGIKNFLDAVYDHSISSPVMHFCLTATTPQLPAVTSIAKLLRATCPDTRLILGGPHITLVNAAYKAEQRRGIRGRAHKAMEQAQELFDVLVAGDGEEAIFLALQDNPPKLIDADDPKSMLFLDNARLNDLPFPARHLVDVESYRYSIDGVPALSMIAQLGCPFECGFCGGRTSPTLRRVRTRSPENIIAEMVHIYLTTGRCGFMLYDDELNVNTEMTKLMKLIAQTQHNLGVEWRLRGFIKAQLFTDEQATAMYKAGFREILVGFESGSPAILRAINKKSTREENTRCVEIARRHGLRIKALMSIGHPGESPDTIQETYEWVIEVHPDDVDFTIITCYPGTPYYDQAVQLPDSDNVWMYTYQKTGAKLFQLEIDYATTADYYKGDPDGGYRSYVFTEKLSAEDLVQARDHLERSVRAKLNIPYNPSDPGIMYEHSMGQHGKLPSNMLRIANL